MDVTPTEAADLIADQLRSRVAVARLNGGAVPGVVRRHGLTNSSDTEENKDTGELVSEPTGTPKREAVRTLTLYTDRHHPAAFRSVLEQHGYQVQAQRDGVRFTGSAASTDALVADLERDGWSEHETIGQRRRQRHDDDNARRRWEDDHVDVIRGWGRPIPAR